MVHCVHLTEKIQVSQVAQGPDGSIDYVDFLRRFGLGLSSSTASAAKPTAVAASPTKASAPIGSSHIGGSALNQLRSDVGLGLESLRSEQVRLQEDQAAAEALQRETQACVFF